MKRARKPCAAKGCPETVLVGERLCERHRGAGRELYTYGWSRASAAYLSRNPLCVICAREGRVTSATVTDHIVPHRGDQELFWDESNYQALCKPHHDMKTGAEDTPGTTKPEWLPLPSCRVILVCGPPGSGKSTYVAKHKKPGDIVVDLDVIKQAVGTEQGDLSLALTERNRILKGLSTEPPTRLAWVIICAPIKLRTWWTQKLQPEKVVVLNTPAAECIARISADPVRTLVAAQQAEAVRRWWRDEVGR